MITSVGSSNAEILSDILDLYSEDGWRILDATWGRGVFWKQTPRAPFAALDIENRKGVNVQGSFLALPFGPASFDMVVFDPPYKLTGTPAGIDRYRNTSYKNVESLYRGGMRECYRVLRSGGIMVVKCMDQVVSGKQNWQHILVKTMAGDMEGEDLFVLVRSPRPQPPGRTQRHALKGHSFFWVFRK